MNDRTENERKTRQGQMLLDISDSCFSPSAYLHVLEVGQTFLLAKKLSKLENLVAFNCKLVMF